MHSHEELQARVDQGTTDLEHALSALEEEFSERRQMAETMREMEHWFRQMTEVLPYVLWLSSADLRVMFYVNPAYERVWGRPLDSLLRKPRSWMDCIHEEDRPQVARTIQEWLDGVHGGKICEFRQKYRVVRPDGTLCPVRAMIFPVRDDQGHIRRACGIAEEMTE